MESRFFKHYDGDARTWRIYDTAIEEDIDESGATSEADAIVDRMNRLAGYPAQAGEPAIDVSSLESIRTWLQWNDPNGVYDDAGGELEGLEPLNLSDALALLVEQLNPGR